MRPRRSPGQYGSTTEYGNADGGLGQKPEEQLLPLRDQDLQRSSATQPPPEPLQLLQLLWPVEGRALSAGDGDADRCSTAVRELVKRRKCVCQDGMWKFEGAIETVIVASSGGGLDGKNDPWNKSDPWSQALSSKEVPPSSRPQAVKDDGEGGASQFEKSALVTKCTHGEAECL